MQSLDCFQTLCRYNRWMNDKLYLVCQSMPDDKRKADRGAFFRSVHGTLNHLLLADRAWLGRFTGKPFTFSSLDQELYADFDELRAQRAITDQGLQRWLDDVTEEELSAPFTYVNSQGREGTYPLWTLALHLFNHQTHHRGQLTTLMNQAGFDTGPTDLMVMPGVASPS